MLISGPPSNHRRVQSSRSISHLRNRSGTSAPVPHVPLFAHAILGRRDRTRAYHSNGLQIGAGSLLSLFELALNVGSYVRAAHWPASVAENDAKGIAPGSNLLEEIFRKCSPCLILIDEWVAYLRQIYKVDGLPSGSFDANLSFVQSLTEAVKTSPGTLLVAALPASQIEVGGEGGQEALVRLKQTFSRVESSWRPASQEESYEIVRRRLFKDIPGDRFHHRDNTLKQFAKLYL